MFSKFFATVGVTFSLSRDRQGSVLGWRCSMQAVTFQECLTFFVSVAVILYLWMQ